MTNAAQTGVFSRRLQEFERTSRGEFVDRWRDMRATVDEFDPGLDLSGVDGFDEAEDVPGGLRRLRADLDLDVFGAHLETGSTARTKFEELNGIVRAHNMRAAALGLEANLTFRQWLGILRWFEFRCAYCRSADGTVLEHVIPISLGGGTTENNVVPSCKSCNSKKGGRAPEGWLDRSELAKSFAELCLGGA